MQIKRKPLIIGTLISGILLVLLVVGLYQLHTQQQPQRERHSTDITVQQFIKQVAPAAQREQKKYHIPASIRIGIRLGPEQAGGEV